MRYFCLIFVTNQIIPTYIDKRAPLICEDAYGTKNMNTECVLIETRPYNEDIKWAGDEIIHNWHGNFAYSLNNIKSLYYISAIVFASCYNFL